MLALSPSLAVGQDDFTLELPEDSGIQELLPSEMDSPSAELPAVEGAEPMVMESETETMAAPDVTVDESAESGLPEGVTVVDEVETPPPTDNLAEPQDSNAVADENFTAPQIPRAQAAPENVDEDLFFDAENLVPQTELSRGGPATVNPLLNPGSRLVITRKVSNPGSSEAQLVAAERAVKLGRLESALQIYEGLYARNNRDPNILLGRATTLQKLGLFDEAILAYEEILNIRPNNVEAQINMQGLMGQRYPAVARRNLLDLFNKNPGNVAVIAQLALVEAKLGNHADAIKFLGIAASIEPENANHIFNMAVVADRAGDRKKAISFYEQALEVDTLYGAGKTIPRENIFLRLAELR